MKRVHCRFKNHLYAAVFSSIMSNRYDMECPGGHVVFGVAILGRRLSCESQASTTQEFAPITA